MVWDYVAEKKQHPCAICGEDPATIGMALPLCHTHEIEWLASAERTERATARQRFIDRVKKEKEKVENVPGSIP